MTVREGQIVIPTYPYAQYTTEAWSEAFQMPYAVLDRAAYDAAAPQPVNASYDTLVVENEYLRLTLVPGLGGRIYEVVYKPTGHRVTYRNPVLKPSPWGPPEQGWWLAAGGIEWCLPVEEHGYEWGVPWAAQVSHDRTGATVTLRDTSASSRVRAEITVRLEVGAGAFTIRPRLENSTQDPLAVKFWINAMLAPGGQNAPSPELRFLLPDTVRAVTIHSRGDDWLPARGERMVWPIVDGRDLSRLGNWGRWLGFFADPAQGDYVAVYDTAYDEGMVRVFPSDVAVGVKVFGLGWGDPIPTGNWTDDASSYVEIHGGPAPTFDDSVTLPTGGYLEWTETWYPVAGLGGLRYANDLVALNLETSPGDGAEDPQARVAAVVTRAWSGEVVVVAAARGAELWRRGVSLAPGQPFSATVPLGEAAPEGGRITIRLESPGGALAAEYSVDLSLE